MVFTKQQIKSMTSKQLANEVLTSGEALKALCNHRWRYRGQTVAEVIKHERDSLIRFFDVIKHNPVYRHGASAVVYPFVGYVPC